MKLNDYPQAGKMTKVDLGSWITEKRALLREKTEFPSIEINVITSRLLGKPVSWIIAHPETILETDQIQKLDGAVERLQAGVPLAYITGNKAFFGLDFIVNEQVLIPRPETEILVEQAISWLEAHPGRRETADIGTGSGIIAISLAKRFPDLRVTAVDISQKALAIARRNASLHAVEHQIHFIQSDLLSGVELTFDLILANLPYIPSNELDTLAVARYEPRLALDGGEDGMKLITELINTLQKKILPNGCVFFEIQYNQYRTVREIVIRKFPKAKISVIKDLASFNRLVNIQL